MKAIQLIAPQQLVEIDIRPPQLHQDHVLLKTHYVGLCGSDLNSYLGRNPLVRYPIIPGHELAATVVAVGSDVPHTIMVGMDATVNPYTHCGDCASCRQKRFNACKHNETMGVQRNGCMQALISVPWQKVVVDDGLRLDELVIVEPLSVGFHAVRRGEVGVGDTVMVLGCGMIGLGAIIGAKHAGATVIAADIDENKLEQAISQGADHAVNTSSNTMAEVLNDLTAGFGPDVMIEAAGLEATYQLAVNHVSYAGRVVCVGYAKQDISFATKQFVHKEIAIFGSRNATPTDFATVMQWIKQHRDAAAKLITQRVSPNDLYNAFTNWAAHTKTIVTF